MNGWGEPNTPTIPMQRDPISRQRSPWLAFRSGIDWATVMPGARHVRTFIRDVHDGSLRAIRSVDPDGLHLSVSWSPHSQRQTVRYPTWDELAHARDALLPADVGFVMHLPPADEYVAVHRTTFHLHEHPPVAPGPPEQGEGVDDTTTVGDGDTTCDEAGLPVDVPVSDGAHSHDVGRLVSEPDPDTEQGRGPGPDTGPLHLDFAQLRRANLARVARWHAGFPHDGWSGADWSNAAAGEMGEAANVVKKLRRGETAMKPGAKDPSRETLLAMLADEIADTITYLDLLAAFYGIDVAAAVIHKFNAVSEREGFPDRLGDDR